MHHMNIFDRLKSEHEKIHDLCCYLLQTSGASEDRKRLYGELKKEINAHTAAEEQTLYAELIRLGKTPERSRQSFSEHREAGGLLSAMDKIDMASPAWMKKFRQLREEMEHHMDEEEKEVFRFAEKAISKKRAQELSVEFDELKTAKI